MPGIEKTKERVLFERVKIYRDNLNDEFTKKSRNSEQYLDEIWNMVKNSINKSAEIFKKESTSNGINSWFNYRCREAIEKRTEARIKMIQD